MKGGRKNREEGGRGGGKGRGGRRGGKKEFKENNTNERLKQLIFCNKFILSSGLLG